MGTINDYESERVSHSKSFSSGKNKVIKYLEVLDMIGQYEQRIEELKNEKARLERDIFSDPAASKIINSLSELEQKNNSSMRKI